MEFRAANRSFSTTVSRASRLQFRTGVLDVGTYDGTITYTFGGRFTSETDATGTIQIDIAFPSLPCQGTFRGTWTATRG